jgi:hypothetical protein
MSFPASLTLVTVNGQVDQLPAGGGAGTARFTSAVRALLGDTLVPYIDVSVTFDSSGTFTVQLPATNDPQWAPLNWEYDVHIQLANGDVRGTIQLDYQTLTVDLADLLQVDGTADAGVSYILASQKGVYGGVAALDPDTGEVLNGDGDPVGGGGGGGGTPSNSVTASTAYGQSPSAGAASTYSRGDHVHGTPAKPTAADISDATTVGRNVLKAADAATARTAIGAGTSSLTIGTTSVTAAAGDAPAAAIATHVAASDPHTQYALESTLGGAALLNVGTTAGTVAAGDDGRMTNSRTPTAHASSHASAGSDPITIAESQVTNLISDLAAKAPLASPTFSGTPSLPTGTTGVTQTAADSTTKLATTAFVTTADNLKAPLASPALTGTPTAPTAAAATNTTQVATTAFATGAVSDHVAASNPHTQYKRTYVESGGTYSVSTTARDFVGADDPATKGFTLVAGDKWYQI